MSSSAGINEKALAKEYKFLSSRLNELERRQWAALKTTEIGRGGIAIMKRVTGLAYETIRRGREEIKDGKKIPAAGGRVRQPGGGRKKLTAHNPKLEKKLTDILESSTRGDPETLLLWSSKSSYHVSEALTQQGHKISQKGAYNLIRETGYSLQGNRKLLEGNKSHQDRDAQFRLISKQAKLFIKEGQPVISVDTKKKENIGNFKNNGQEYHPKGNAPKVNTHDFIDKEKGKAAPYGIYDVGQNKGWVSVGISSDTAEFSVNAIRTWWKDMGHKMYPKATKILITADSGGSNGYRLRLWKVELQKLAKEIGLDIHVSHFPPGMSKWNKVEHRMFSAISQNWRGRPLVDLMTLVNLIAHTTTKTGLKIKVKIDENIYPLGITVSDKDLAKVKLKRNKFHGEWNYTILK